MLILFRINRLNLFFSAGKKEAVFDNNNALIFQCSLSSRCDTPSIIHPDSLISWGAEFVDKISKIDHITSMII